MHRFIYLLLTFLFLINSFSCRRVSTEFVTIALPEKFSTFDTLTTVQSDAAAERVKNLMFNALVKKNENFDYVGELAREIQTSPDGLTITFTLNDGIKFHNGKEFTSADVKYTFDELFKANGYKAGAFFDTIPVDKTESAKASPTPASSSPTNASGNSNTSLKPVEEVKSKRVAHITSITTPDTKTVVFTITRPALHDQLLANLVAVPIIPEGTAAQQKDNPVGSGPFKFIKLDSAQSIVELASNPDYWQGAPKIPKIRLKTVTDATSLQAELQTGGVDIAPNPSNLPPDILKALGGNPNLKVDPSDGSNLQYLVFNTSQPPLNNPKIRQAIAYAIDRNKIVTELLSNQAKVATSILPTQSWAYAPGKNYPFDPAKAKQLLQEAGYKNESITFKYGAGNAMVNQYAQVIQSSLNDIGLNVQIETLEVSVIRAQMAQGQFQMYTGVWIGGNTDPIFFKNLFSTSMIPSAVVPCCNRGRYSNPQVDKVIEDAINSSDRTRAKEFYSKTWELVSEDMPLLPLWYPANIVVSNKRIGNIKISPSGEWTFIKDLTVAN